jgi:hypothetical protein
MTKTLITEAEFEKMVDAIVMRRLDSDMMYLHAEDAETQNQREAYITAEVEDLLTEKYEVR